MYKKLVSLLAITFFCQGFASICYFIPPKNWRCADPAKLSKHVLIGFVGKGKSSFNPSINLASEKTELSLQEYIQAIKDSYKHEKKTTVREIGRLKNQTKGDTTLIEISKLSAFGEIKLLQAVTKMNEDIYILTAAVLKDEILKFKDDFFKSLKSLKITDNLLKEASLQNPKVDLENTFSDLKKKKISIKDFETFIEKNYSSLGSYWKILVLKHAYQSLSEN